MDINEFYELLEKHDWYYEYSDDSRVFGNGRRGETKIKTLIKDNAERKELYEAFKAHYFSGPIYGTNKAPRPIKPT